MEEFPSNSRLPRPDAKAATPDAKNVESVVTNPVIRRKKPMSKRFVETFFGGDAKGVVGYVMLDVLLPAARDAMSDAFSSGIDRLLYGEERRGPRRPNRYGGMTGSYTSYNRFSQPGPGRHREDPRAPRRSRNSHEIDDIIVATRVEANEIIDRLFGLVETYNVATVADLNSMINVSSNHMDPKWGWQDLRGAGVVHTSAGYLIDLPKPEYLE